MKKKIILVSILLLTIFLYSCSLTGGNIDTDPEQDETIEEITSIQESVILDIAITLNEYYVRYFDGNEGAFDITVEGNIDSYEILYLPIETPYETPQLDESGLPHTIGKYEVAVKCMITGLIETCDTGLFVEIIERPPLVNQLVGTSEDIIYSKILTSIKWEEEVTILAEEDKIIESDYYIAHLSSGDEYSSWLFPLLDEILGYIHELTGLYLPETNEKVYIWFGDSKWGFSPVAGRDDQTGNLILYLNDYKLSPFFGMSEEELNDILNHLDHYRQYWMETLILQFAHEFTHVLSFAFLDMTTYSWIQEEGYATFVGGFTKEHFVKDPITKTGNQELEDSIVDIISDYAHNRLEDALSRDDGAGDLNGAGRAFGAVFYRYIFLEHGSSYAFEIHRAMNERPTSPSRLEIIREILGKDISESFPAWYDKNSSEIEIHW